MHTEIGRPLSKKGTAYIFIVHIESEYEKGMGISMVDLKGRVALVTGGARGNGYGMAEVMGELGATIMIFDIDSTLDSAVAKLKEKGIIAKGYHVDITKPEQVKEGVKQILEEQKKIDILVNNAGIARLSKFDEMSDELRDLHFNINILGAWNCTKAVIPNMIQNRYGRIVNISSVTGPMVCDSGFTAYATSKAALIGFTKSLAVEYADRGITVNAVLPGYLYTPMVQKSAEESNPDDPQSVIDGIASGIPMKRLGETRELGQLVAFLASDCATYITGTQNVFDGGSTLPETHSMGV